MDRLSDWVKVGTCGVDAGCIMLVDPCYVLPNEDDQKAGKVRACYEEFLKQAENGFYDKGFMPFKDGVIVSSGYGDGEYNVYVKFGLDGWSKGRVAEVKVVFFGEQEEEEEDNSFDDEDNEE
jgi:hypothetical protein